MCSARSAGRRVRRDADSAKPSVFFRFGLLRDDHTPKPAFEAFRRLVAELTGAG